MSVKTIFWENRLTKLIRQPGGVTIEDALTRGENNLAGIQGRCQAALDEKLALLRACAATPTPDGREAALKALYDLGNDIVGLAQPAGFPQISAAAYSLCDLVDRLTTREANEWSSVVVHIESIGLLRGALGKDIAAGAEVLEGLKRLMEHLRSKPAA